MIDLDALHRLLIRRADLADLTRAELRPMAVKGIAHDHIRIGARGLIVRAPRLSQWAMAPADNLAYQAACFERAAPSGHTPRLVAVIVPEQTLPFGALVVEEIIGRPPVLPRALPALAEALARVHALPIPPEPDRPPLAYHRDPVGGTLARIESQATAIEQLDIAARARAAILEELDWMRRFAAGVRGLEQPLSLVMTDTHPGNFLIDADGRAIFLDLEKGLYGSPAIDLAHATLYTSTMWDRDIATVLEPLDVARFYRAYFDTSEAGYVQALRPWITPMRRLTWLRTTTWAAHWLVENAADANVPETLMVWIRERIADYFDPATIERIRAEWLGEEPLDVLI